MSMRWASGLVAMVSLVGAGCVVDMDGEYDADVTFAAEVALTAKSPVEVLNTNGAICVREGSADRVRLFGRVRVDADTVEDAEAAAALVADNAPIRLEGTKVVVGDLAALEDQLPSNVWDLVLDLGVEVPAGSDVKISNTSGSSCAEGLSGAISIETTSGDVSVKDATGSATVKGSSGDVKLARVGQAWVETASGDVSADAVGAITIGTVSGDVAVNAAGSNVNVTTTSGDVDVDGAIAAAASWEVETTSGDVTFALPSAESFHLQLESVAGDVTSDFATDEWFTDHRSIDGQVGEAADALIRAKTTSGDIRVNEQHDGH